MKGYIKQLCEMLLKDNLTQNGKRKIVNYIDNLQQRIDKAIEFINNHTHYYDDGEYSGYECEIDGLKLLSILQGEEVKK